LQEKVRYHISLAQNLKEQISEHNDFELMAPVPLNTICFRFRPGYISDERKLDELNQKLLNLIQESGKLFLTHTRLDDKFTIRIVLGNTNLEKRHVDRAWALIKKTAETLIQNS
jgi:aromatic-L-amino-acid decarboxylase